MINNIKFPVYPLPKILKYGKGTLLIPNNKSVSHEINSKDTRDNNLFRSWALRHNLELTEQTDGNIKLVLIRKTEKDMMYRESEGIYSAEIYKINCSNKNSIFTAEIFYAALPGLRNALASMTQIFKEESMLPCTFTDYPDFKIRGIIEGYYGPPWEDSSRLKILDFLEDWKFNAYFYGPKDDAFHRERWKDSYDNDSLKKLKLMVKQSAERALDFWYTLGPGLSMKYSSEQDISDLLNKFIQLAELGIRHFGLLFDDIPEELQHSEDQKVFSDLPEAHITVSNRIYKELTSLFSDLKFVVCPTQYHGKGNEYYISRLGDDLDPRIEIFWTGPEICSRTLSLDNTSLLARQIHRPVLFWDNYPVNDLEMAQELHIGPYRERDIHLFRASSGIVANGMEHPESSRIAFHTIGAYLWSAENYDPEKAWNIALQNVVGSKDWEVFRIFADNSRYSCLYPKDSPDLAAKLHQFEFEKKYGDPDKALSILKGILTELQKAVDLFEAGLENEILQKEIAPWTEKFSKGTNLLTIIYNILQKPEKNLFEELSVLFSEYQFDKIRIFADVLYRRIEDFIESNSLLQE